MKYIVIIGKYVDKSGEALYTATAPDFHLLQGQGDTPEEAEQELYREILEDLEDRRLNGEPIPEPTTVVREIEVERS